MSNAFLPSRFTELVHRLAVGIEPRDALTGAPAVGARLRLEAPVALRDARLLAGDGRWSLRYVPGLPAEVDVRVEDPTRRYVPRRLRIALPGEDEVTTAERDGTFVPLAKRVWRPVLLPGATYPLPATATVVRGRALRNGAPARWVRVEARAGSTTRVVGRAHGDDRGEFLLVVWPDPVAPAALPATLKLTITARARKPAPNPPAADPLWDLPVEPLAPPGPPNDDPAAGTRLPSGYSPGFRKSLEVELAPGRVHLSALTFDLA